MAGQLEGRVAIITGGARGMGEAGVRLFAAQGAKVVFGDVLDGEGEALAKTVPGSTYVHLDVSREEQWAAAVKLTLEKHGRIDVLVNNAAINPPTRTILNDTLEDWRRTIAINLESVYMGSKLVAPHMVAQKAGRIIHIASIQGYASSGDCGSYNAAKGGIIAYTKSMAVELGRYNILVNAVAPGFMLTPMSIVNGVDETKSPDFVEWYVEKRKIPLGRTGYPEDVSGTVVFLASDYCRYMTGQLLTVDGGLMSTF